MSKYIGSFMLGNKVDITDPCYNKDVWCRMTTECTPGEYYGYVEQRNTSWGNRNTVLTIYKDDVHVDDIDMEYIGEIGVDSGMVGFFNDKPNFPDDKWYEFLEFSKVFKKNGEYNYSKKTYIVDYGIFCESGYGDGCYNVYANKERTAFEIVFIDDEED